MKHLFLLATVAMITVEMSFAYFHSSSCQGNIPSSKSCNLLVQTITGKMESNRDKDYWRKFVTLTASLDTLYFNPLNLRNKITKIEHKKIFCSPSKILKNILWSIDICLKYFMTPTKILRPPFYIVNVPSLTCHYKTCLEVTKALFNGL